MADVEVRTAAASDAAEIARIQLATWRSAYAELLPSELLDELDGSETELQWQRTLADGPAEVLIATEGAWVVGFCAAGMAPDEESAEADGTAAPDAPAVALVSTLLVEPRWGRRGHGGRLLGVMARRLTEAGATRGIAWIPEADTASMKFFRELGWDPDGTVRTLDAGGRPLRELRLSGSLDLQLTQP